MMRHHMIILAACLLASCGKAPDGVADEPDVNVSAAPGVAFSYRYSYTLPPAVIAGVQETHALSCERLGLVRCRIIGMTYNVRSPEHVDGSLSFKLDPAAARAFGRQGTSAVEAADGMLSAAAIEGNDVGSEITATDAGRADLASDRARLDREIGAASPAQRPSLIAQRGLLDAQVRDITANNRARQASLATTPITFSYQSGVAIRSLHAVSPLTRAADTAIGSIQATLSFVLQTLAILFAPALLAILLWLGWRWQGRRLWRMVRGPVVADGDPSI